MKKTSNSLHHENYVFLQNCTHTWKVVAPLRETVNHRQNLDFTNKGMGFLEKAKPARGNPYFLYTGHKVKSFIRGWGRQTRTCLTHFRKNGDTECDTAAWQYEKKIR